MALSAAARWALWPVRLCKTGRRPHQNLGVPLYPRLASLPASNCSLFASHPPGPGSSRQSRDAPLPHLPPPTFSEGNVTSLSGNVNMYIPKYSTSSRWLTEDWTRLANWSRLDGRKVVVSNFCCLHFVWKLERDFTKISLSRESVFRTAWGNGLAH